MKAILKGARISPKKANLVAGLVRGKMVDEALDQLKFTPKKGAAILTKVIKSAAANAKTNFKQDPAKLFIKEIIVTKGPTFKRSVSISRGRAHPILKRNSHITVKVDVKVDASKASVAEAPTSAEAKAPKEQPSKPPKKD